MKIAILGAGAFGTALGGILTDNGYEVDYYDPNLFHNALSDVLDNASYILLVAPSSALGGLLKELPKDKPLIVATKGIMTDKIFDGFSDAMVLSGPGFADDIKNRKTVHLTATDNRIKQLFKADYLQFDETTDRLGVLMCGSLKNIYAILAGYLGISKDTSEYDSFIKSAVNEMGLVLAANGADRNTANLYCGRDDLIISCSPRSRNYEFGMKYRASRDYRPEKTVEGLSALKQVKQGGIIVPENATYLKQLTEIL